MLAKTVGNTIRSLLRQLNLLGHVFLFSYLRRVLLRATEDLSNIKGLKGKIICLQLQTIIGSLFNT